jgi:hypothetical protein
MGVKKKYIRKILRYQDWLVEELYNWATTFDWEYDDEGERTTASLDYVWNLAEKLENNLCDEKDYRDILFHIYQINYDRRVIKGWAISVDYGYQIEDETISVS